MEILRLQILWTWICINLIWQCYWQAQLSLHIFYPIIFHDIQNTSLDYYLQKLIYSFRIVRWLSVVITYSSSIHNKYSSVNFYKLFIKPDKLRNCFINGRYSKNENFFSQSLNMAVIALC